MGSAEDRVAEIVAAREGKPAQSATEPTPQRAKVPRMTTERRKAAFIEELTRRGIVTDAARAAGVHRCTPYAWYEDDAEFAAAWVDAVEQAIDTMESEAFRRAVEGLEKPVFQGGRCVGSIREYSDTLLIAMLKAHRPAKYRDHTSMEITGANGGPIRHADTSPEKLQAYALECLAAVEAAERICAQSGGADGATPADSDGESLL
jgi:hypothetical protein